MSTTPRPLHLDTPSHSSSIPALLQAWRALGTALSWLSNLPHDSRDSLPSKDTDLATYGVNWATDLAHETGLAQELERSRLLRRAGVTIAPEASQMPVSPSPEAGTLDGTALVVPAAMGAS